MPLGSDRTWEEWVDAYSQSHQHPVNKRCHRIGIPMIVVSIALALCSLLLAVVGLNVFWLAVLAAGLFIVGWVFQFVGHAYEGQPPEFLRDWRFLFVGLRWWWQNRRG